jgi:Flp pilus assembly protein TadG
MRSERCRVACARVLRARRVVGGDGGTVTAELAVCLPVLVLFLAVMLSAVSVAGLRVRAQDAAREAARAAARGDEVAARELARQAAPGVALTLASSGDQVTATAQVSAHLLAHWLPAVTVREQAGAALEPEDTSPVATGPRATAPGASAPDAIAPDAGVPP